MAEDVLDIAFEKDAYRSGEVLKGKISLRLKRPRICKELRTTLMAEREVSEKGGKRIDMLYMSQIVLDKEKEYAKGTYEFEMKLPDVTLTHCGFMTRLARAIPIFKSRGPVVWVFCAELEMEEGPSICKKVRLKII